MDRHGSLNVFLVEDNILYQNALKHHLEANIENIHIRAFKNGEEMLPLINQNPDVIVLDYMLHTHDRKARNGMSILKKVAYRKPYTPVIIFSGQKDKSLIPQLVNEGAYDYVAKSTSGIERVTYHIRHIASQLIENKRQNRIVGKATLWAFALSALITFLFYEINK